MLRRLMLAIFAIFAAVVAASIINIDCAAADYYPRAFIRCQRRHYADTPLMITLRY